METVSPAASAFAYSKTVREALNIISVLGLVANLNPPDSCVRNNSIVDYIIVGGGTAGCVVANRLTEDSNVRVLVIEAGPNFDIDSIVPTLATQAIESRIDWNFTSLPDGNYGRCHKDNHYKPIVAKVLGGESSIDYLLYSQGSKSVYNTWYNITNEPAWLYPNVLRLFKKVERLNDTEIRNSPEDAAYHGFNGNIALYKNKSPTNEKYYTAFRQVGTTRVLDLNNRTRYGNNSIVTGAIYYISDGVAQNSAMNYLNVVRNRPNLLVIKKAQVTKILFNKNKKAIAVVVVTEDKRTFVFRASVEIIVSAGPFNSAKLLQLSGIGPKNLLSSFNIPVISDLPVGRNYINHIATPVVGATIQTRCKLVPEIRNPGDYPSLAMISYTRVNSYYSYNSTYYDEYRTVSSIIPVTPPTGILNFATTYCRFKDEIVDYWYNKGIGREMFFTMIENINIASRGVVRIRNRDPFQNPVVDTKYYSNSIDVENMVRYVKDFVRIFDTPYFKKIGAFFIDPTRGSCGSYEKFGDDYWRCYVRCLMVPRSHHAGTCAMGSVVDGRLRVKGVKGVRVVDAGVMPTLVEGSTTIPTMMIGENAAEMIKEDNNRYRTVYPCDQI